MDTRRYKIFTIETTALPFGTEAYSELICADCSIELINGITALWKGKHGSMTVILDAALRHEKEMHTQRKVN